jgi:RNA polymerase sigma factor (sigma-70 family)
MNAVLDSSTIFEVTKRTPFAEPDASLSSHRTRPVSNHLDTTTLSTGKDWVVRESVRTERAEANRAAQERDALYAEFRPLVNRLIRKYGDTLELRKDLEGEIFCLFCGLLDAFDPGRGVPLKAYLVHQLTASVYTFARRRWRREQHEISLELREDTTQTMDPSAEWDQEIALQSVRELLPNAIAALPQRQRQVVIWRYYEHRSFEEIAQSLDIQVATARSILRHGLNNLRRAFANANVSLEE